jgi:hypothetical protein
MASEHFWRRIHMSKKKEDLGAWENPHETLEKRKTDRDNLLNVLDAIDSQYTVEVANILKERGKKDGKKTVDYTYIHEGHENYDKDTAQKVREAVDNNYNVKNDLHPLKEVFMKELGKDNHYLDEFLNDVFFRHKEQMRKAVGQSDFMEVVQNAQFQNKRQNMAETLDKALNGLDTDAQKDKVLGYFIDHYNVDEKRIQSKDLLKRNIKTIAQGHISRDLKTESIYDQSSPNYQQ